MTSSGENGPNIRTNASSKMGQDQVSGGASVFYGNIPEFSNRVRVGNKA